MNFPKPQDMGNHEDVRWCTLTNEAGTGAAFIAGSPVSVSALPYSALDMILASHPYQLPRSEEVYLHIDCAVTGLGGNSCGQGGPLLEDRVFADTHSLSFAIRPVTADGEQVCNVVPVGEKPLTMERTMSGVEIKSLKGDEPICYELNRDGKVHEYHSPIPLREGGTVKAWLKDRKQLSVLMEFVPAESTQTKVVYASSQEAGTGDASHLTDGDPTTIWHTMHSVTVAQYPHWVDFDLGERKTIYGLTYLPRQDSEVGHIKNYAIQVSQDGKQWSQPVAEGTFDRSRKEQKVLFTQQVKARYVRFTAQSEQQGSDEACGAEIGILAE